MLLVTLLLPEELVAVSLMISVPVLLNVTGCGDAAVLVATLAPAPNSHRYDVGLPVLWFVKLTVNGQRPEEGVKLKLGVGTGTTGAAVATMAWVAVLFPNVFDTVNDTLYVPGVVKVTGDGNWLVLVCPFPKFQVQVVPLAPVLLDVSVKVTVKGATPDVVEDVKDADGGGEAGL